MYNIQHLQSQATGSINHALTKWALPVIALCLAASSAVRAEYRFTQIDMPTATTTAIYGNSERIAVGDYTDANNRLTGFILNKKGSRKGFFSFDIPGSRTTMLTGVNEYNQITGTYDDQANRLHAFLVDPKSGLKQIEAQDSIDTIAGGINNWGDVVGTFRDLNGTGHAFFWRNGVFTTIDPNNVQNLTDTDGRGINDLRQVVGNYDVADNNIRHGFLLSNGVFTTVDIPNAVSTMPYGLNNKGKIVGTYTETFFDGHGFVLDIKKGKYETVDVPNATFTVITSINDEGEIAGFFEEPQGFHGFIGKPVKR